MRSRRVEPLWLDVRWSDYQRETRPLRPKQVSAYVTVMTADSDHWSGDLYVNRRGGTTLARFPDDLDLRSEIEGFYVRPMLNVREAVERFSRLLPVPPEWRGQSSSPMGEFAGLRLYLSQRWVDNHGSRDFIELWSRTHTFYVKRRGTTMMFSDAGRTFDALLASKRRLRFPWKAAESHEFARAVVDLGPDLTRLSSFARAQLRAART